MPIHIKNQKANNIFNIENIESEKMTNASHDADLVAIAKDLLSKNMTEEAIDFIIENSNQLTNNFSVVDRFILLSSRLREIKDKQILGVISNEEIGLEMSKVKYSFLLLLNEI